MNQKRVATVCGIVCIAAGLVACAVPESGLARPIATTAPAGVAAPGVAVTASLLAGTTWTAFAIDGVAEVLIPKPKLRWDLSQRVSGTGGCNAFGGTSVVGYDSLRLGPLAPTGKTCLTLPGAQEDLFFKVLELTRKARIEGDQLVLLDATGKTLARFLAGN